MMHHRSLIGSAALLVLLGCGGVDGPDLGQVTGTVLMDGNPVSNAVLVFQPEHARPSYGRTDAEGKYELYYTDEKPGATIGEHRISITTGEEGDEDSGQAGQKESIPAKYNIRTELTREVAAGENTIDFKLDSEGQIVEQRDDAP